MRPVRPKNTKTRKKALSAGFRSGAEYTVAKDLIERGIKFDYEKHKYTYIRNVRSGVCKDCGGRSVGKRSTYTPDFYLRRVNKFVEVKGRFVAADRAKLQTVVSEIRQDKKDLFILFGADNAIAKGSKTRYSTWAKANGFEFHVGKTIPIAWTL